MVKGLSETHQMDGLDLLGAAESLGSQYITLRVKSIDPVKLKAALGGTSGSTASSVLPLVDFAPKAVIDLAAPFITKAAKGYGVDLEVVVSGKPPAGRKRAISEFFPGLVAGVVIGGSGLLIIKGISRLLGRR